MVRTFTCIVMGAFFFACGKPESQAILKEHNMAANPMTSESNAPINENIVASTIKSDSHDSINENSFKKCSGEFAPIPSTFPGFFHVKHRKSAYLTGQIADYIEENGFNQQLKNLSFTKDEPCEQIKVAFSGDFANVTALDLKISRSDADRELVNRGHIRIQEFPVSYLRVISDFLPDNLTRLPDHHFAVDVLCPTGMTVSCPLEEKNCGANKSLEAKFPDEPCAIKGTDQIFALYPNGQARINFEGTITKIGTSENNMDEVEIKFTNIEWR